MACLISWPRIEQSLIFKAGDFTWAIIFKRRTTNALLMSLFAVPEFVMRDSRYVNMFILSLVFPCEPIALYTLVKNSSTIANSELFSYFFRCHWLKGEKLRAIFRYKYKCNIYSKIMIDNSEFGNTNFKYKFLLKF